MPFGGLTKEQTRHIRRAIGDQASQMINDILQKATATHIAQAALAREMEAVNAELRAECKKLAVRADGAGAWCQKNEDAARQLVVLCYQQRVALEGILLTSAWARLKWVLFGFVPPVAAERLRAIEVLSREILEARHA